MPTMFQSAHTSFSKRISSRSKVCFSAFAVIDASVEECAAEDLNRAHTEADFASGFEEVST